MFGAMALFGSITKNSLTGAGQFLLMTMIVASWYIEEWFSILYQ
jgi:FtsH-binding integral membrane protein